MLPSAIEGDDVVSDYVWLHVCARVNDIHIPVQQSFGGKHPPCYPRSD